MNIKKIKLLQIRINFILNQIKKLKDKKNDLTNL